VKQEGRGSLRLMPEADGIASVKRPHVLRD
jgi:hypothetical protein